MADMTPSRIGAINGGVDKDALFLKVFAGEVLTAFAETNVFMSRHMVRTIEHGKSASFPASGKGTASYHTPGKQLLGTGVNHAERIITIDDLLVADRSIAQIDEAKNHYDVRSIYSRDVGMALSRAFDMNVAQVAALAARASATVTGGNGGTRVEAATIKTDAAVLEDSIFAAAQALDEKDVPDTDRYVFLKPEQYYLLVNSTSRSINRDFGGRGSPADGTIFSIAGIQIVKSNNVPSTNIATGPTAYQGNFTTTAGIVMHQSAVGTVKLLDLSVEMQWLIEYQTNLIVGKYAVGHGILRPESAVELATGPVV